MEAKLIKRPNGIRWDLYLKKDINMLDTIASTEDGAVGKLSLKNCEAIANGYDLDELVKERFGEAFWHDGDKYFKEGFKKALEILGDKKFSVDDILIAMVCMQGQEVFYEKTFEETQETRKLYIENYIKHLQQTEWDVEIVMDKDCYSSAGRCDNSTMADCIICTPVTYLKDADGCLILKRI